MGKLEMPFGKNSHVDIIRPIAVGLHKAKMLKNYVELGIRRGPCFTAVAPLCKNAYAVDINDECLKHIKQHDNLRWFHGTTLDFFKQLDKSVKFDLAFIDADHKHESSLADFEALIPHLKENSFVLLHDTYPPAEEFTTKSYCFDTYKTALYIKENYGDEFEIITFPFYFGVSVVRKCPKNKQLIWK